MKKYSFIHLALIIDSKKIVCLVLYKIKDNNSVEATIFSNPKKNSKTISYLYYLAKEMIFTLDLVHTRV